MLIGSHWGVIGVAWAWAVTAPAIWLILVGITLHRLEIGWGVLLL